MKLDYLVEKHGHRREGPLMRPKFIRLWVRGTYCSSQCASPAFPAGLPYPLGCCLGPIISYESIDSCSVVSTTELLLPQDFPASLPKHRVLVAEGLLDLRSRNSANIRITTVAITTGYLTSCVRLHRV